MPDPRKPVGRIALVCVCVCVCACVCVCFFVFLGVGSCLSQHASQSPLAAQLQPAASEPGKACKCTPQVVAAAKLYAATIANSVAGRAPSDPFAPTNYKRTSRDSAWAQDSTCY